MEYMSGDPALIKNIVTQLKSQGIFDQFRKECIADVDTKPAYQNLCHLADTQVSKFLSKVKWGPDLNKNQIRENIRRQVNECSFVEPGIAIIVDQLVNPRINTVLVPKVEDMLYKYLGIPREVDTSASHKETKSSKDKNSFKDVHDGGVPGISPVDIPAKKKDNEKSSSDKFNEIIKSENLKHEKTFLKNDSTIKTQINDKHIRDKISSIKNESIDVVVKDSNKPVKMESEKYELKIEEKPDSIPEFESESSDDEMSPPFEPNEKSDNDMSIGSGDSNFSEIIDTKITEPEIPGVEPEIPGIEPEIPGIEPEIPGIDSEIDNICKADDSKIITEHEDSMDSVRSTHSIPPEPPVPEKINISPLDIPKTPTINYETSDDSDDYIKNKKLLDTIPVDAVEPIEAPEVNFDKIVEKVIEDNADSVAKPVEKSDPVSEPKPPKKEDKHKDKNRSEDAKKKYKHKDEKSKPVESKDKHVEKKPDHRSDKDRKHDKHRSEHKSKDREKERSRHDSSKSHRKDDKSHHSRDHSKSEHDRKSKSEHKKDDKPDYKKDDKGEHKKDPKTEHKKDDKTEHRKDSRSDRKKDDDRKHDDRKHSSRDDKDRKKDSHRSSSTVDDKKSKPKIDDSKHKHDKSKDDKKPKNGDHHKTKKKEEDVKKSRSHCNIDDKKKTDRRSSDRDSSGPSTSHSSIHPPSQHSSKTDKERSSNTSSKHRHSSSSSQKTKKNDSEHEKNNEKAECEKNLVEDDLEMILGSSPDKGFQNNIKNEVPITRNLFQDKTAGNDHIEDMMNEMFQPSEPSRDILKASNESPEKPIKKPKIAKNFADIRRIMKLRKLYEEDFKLKEGHDESNGSAEEMDAEKSVIYKIKLRKTVDYFVTRRFGKNGNNLEKCKELTNAIIETLTDVKLNITRVDHQYPLVDGSCILSDDETNTIFNNIATDEKNQSSKTCFNEDVENLSIIQDERANLVLEDLAKSYTDPNFKLGHVPVLGGDDDKSDNQPPADTVKIIQSEIKANGAKKRLPKKVDENETEKGDDTSPSLKLKFKSTYEGKSKKWHACDNTGETENEVYYLPAPNYDNEFINFANGLLNEAYDFEMNDLTVEMDYPECYDSIFTQLGAKVIRKPDDSKTSPIKYNSEIMHKKSGDKSIVLRIKKTSESEEPDQRILKKRKLTETSIPNDSNVNCDENEPAKKKRKTLGIRKATIKPFKIKLMSGKVGELDGNDQAESPTAKMKNTPLSKKSIKNDKNKIQENSLTNVNHKISESESSDGRRSSVSSTGTSTHSKGANESPLPKNKTKNTTSNDSTTDTLDANATTAIGATSTKTMDVPKKPNDTKNSEEKRKQSIMNCYYDESDLYKPRPSLRLTSRRYRLGNTENT